MIEIEVPSELGCLFSVTIINKNKDIDLGWACEMQKGKVTLWPGIGFDEDWQPHPTGGLIEKVIVVGEGGKKYIWPEEE